MSKKAESARAPRRAVFIHFIHPPVLIHLHSASPHYPPTPTMDRMEDSEDEHTYTQHRHEFEQLERLLTPVQRPLRNPLVAPSSAPAASLPHPHSQTYAHAHAPFVSPASVAELYGLTPQSIASKLPDLNLPALALPATLASSTGVGGGVGVGAGGGFPNTETNARAEDAFRYVMQREQAALMQLLALSHSQSYFHPDADVNADAELGSAVSAASKLHRALRVSGSGAGVADAQARVQRALGRWVVHEHVPSSAAYYPAAAEAAVLARARAQNTSVYEEFKESVRTHAEMQKEELKVELDKRRVALAGILSDKHAKAVNNQKSAHLSKFLAAQITAATDQLVRWLVFKRYV